MSESLERLRALNDAREVLKHRKYKILCDLKDLDNKKSVEVHKFLGRTPRPTKEIHDRGLKQIRREFASERVRLGKELQQVDLELSANRAAISELNVVIAEEERTSKDLVGRPRPDLDALGRIESVLKDILAELRKR